jgi:hypothetical protein
MENKSENDAKSDDDESETPLGYQFLHANQRRELNTAVVTKFNVSSDGSINLIHERKIDPKTQFLASNYVGELPVTLSTWSVTSIEARSTSDVAFLADPKFSKDPPSVGDQKNSDDEKDAKHTGSTNYALDRKNGDMDAKRYTGDNIRK